MYGAHQPTSFPPGLGRMAQRRSGGNSQGLWTRRQERERCQWKGANGRVVEGLRVRWLGANGGGGFCVCFFGGCYTLLGWSFFFRVFFFAGFGRWFVISFFVFGDFLSHYTYLGGGWNDGFIKPVFVMLQTKRSLQHLQMEGWNVFEQNRVEVEVGRSVYFG